MKDTSLNFNDSPLFRQIHQLICYDVTGGNQSDPEDIIGVPRPEHLRAIFRFADSIPAQPMLVHCQAGGSRSTAVALALIVRGMYSDGFAAEEIGEQAPQMLL